MSDDADKASDTQSDPKPRVPAYVERRENCPRYIFAGGVWIVLADEAHTSGPTCQDGMVPVASRIVSYRA